MFLWFLCLHLVLLRKSMVYLLSSLLSRVGVHLTSSLVQSSDWYNQFLLPPLGISITDSSADHEACQARRALFTCVWQSDFQQRWFLLHWYVLIGRRAESK